MSVYRVLIIEDDEDYAFLEEDILSDELESEIKTIASGEELSTDLIEFADVFLLDYNLPDSTGTDIIPVLRKHSEAPIIIVTGDDQLQTAVETLKEGAVDFLVKSPKSITVLPKIVKRTVDEYRTSRQLLREQKEKELLHIKIETLRQVLTTLAHYINNATTTIFGYAQLCKQDSGNLNRYNKLVEVSLTGTQKITLVLKELENLINSEDLQTTDYANIPNAMFAIEERIKKKMDELE